MHIRRGDFQGHCDHLARWSAGWNGFNLFPALVDKFVPPPLLDPPEQDVHDDDDDASDEDKDALRVVSPETLALYRARCFPTPAQIVRKAREVRASSAGAGLGRVYVMTNGERAWVKGLVSALRKDGWGDVVSSLDLRLEWEAEFVGQAVDMLIGQRAQVFIGNGVSRRFACLSFCVGD